MIERVEERFGLKPERLIGDTAYGTTEHVGLDGRGEADRCRMSGLGQD